ncbi:MAG: patatin-like phospholipase family protein [Noviherbaspirillum sp.]
MRPDTSANRRPAGPSTQPLGKPEGPDGKNWEKIVDYSLRHQDKEILVGRRQGNLASTSSSTIAIIGRLFGAFKPAAATNTPLANAKAHLIDYLKAEVRKIGEGLPSSEANADRLSADPSGQIEEMANDIMQAASPRGKNSLTGEAIAKAHIAAQKQLMALRQRQLKTVSTPQVIPLNDGKICVIGSPPPLTNLVLRGGGMKGQGYVGVLKVLEQNKLTAGLRNVAGTSAGAITAACLATGMSAERFEALSNALDMNEQMEDLQDAPRQPGSADDDRGFGQDGAPLRLKKGLVSKSAGKLLATVQQQLKENVRGHLSNRTISAWEPGNADKALKRNALRELQSRLDGTAYQLTFADLALLHEFDPQHFKLLTLTGFNMTDRESVTFSVDTFPDMPVATAMRISMAIPQVIDSVMIKVGDQYKEMADGVVGANLPSHLLNPYALGGAKAGEGPANPAARQGSALADAAPAADSFARTLVLSFDEKGKAEKILHQYDKAPGMVLVKKLFAKAFAPSMIQAGKDDMVRFHEAGPHALTVHHGKLDTVDFGASSKKIRAAQIEAEARFLERIRLNGIADQDRAMHRVFESARDAVDNLSVEDLNAFLEPGEDILKAQARNGKEGKKAEEAERVMGDIIRAANKKIQAGKPLSPLMDMFANRV